MIGIPQAISTSEGFTPPGPGDFNLPPVLGGEETFGVLGQSFSTGATKPTTRSASGNHAAMPSARPATAAPAIQARGR